MRKAERLNGIVFSLKEKGRLSAKDIAEIFEVSERTVYRDIDALSQLKVPITAFEGLGGGYEIDKAYFMPSIKLTEHEAIMLLLILKLGDAINIPNYKSDYSVLKSKIYNTLVGVDGERVESVLEKVGFQLSHIKPAGYAKGVLSCIIESFLQTKQVIFTYYTPAKDTYIQRRVSPKDLHFDVGGWYLTGYCHLRKEKRVFRLDRISDIALLDDTNEHVHDALSSRDEKFISVDYILEIDRSLYRLIKDNVYFENSQILRDEDPIRIKIRTKFESVISHLVLENPTGITLIKPDHYVDKMKLTIGKLQNKYNNI